MRHPSRMIKRQLDHIRQIYSLDKNVINDVISIGAVSVTLYSHRSRTGKPRTIPYSWLRKPNYQGTHGNIVRSLQQILGL